LAARVLLVSVDGLPTAWLDDPTLKLPHLRALRARGGTARGLVGVLPTTTYPIHTTLITGTFPDRHGIVDNRVFDPTGIHRDAWYWYAEDVRVPTLLDAARSAGLHTASVDWPATVGAKADWLMPEYWRDRTPLDFKLLRALSTPGLFEAATSRLGPAALSGSPDRGIAEVACAILERDDPALMLLHLVGVDEALHVHGLHSSLARQAAETADAALGRVLAVLESAGHLDSAAVVVVSDHGFKDVEQSIRPATALRSAGLLEVDSGRVVNWRAAAHPTGGTCLFYLANADDHESLEKLLEVVSKLAAEPQNGIRRILPAEELRRQRADPLAVLGLLAADGYAFAHSLSGPLVAPASRPGEHGYDPADPDMFGIFIAAGAGIRPGQRLEQVQAIDVAPTIAALLGLELPQAEGHPIGQLLLK
jgi:predicted AlkP superfamily pyrophosphatase or phosphodiesterase